MLKKLILKAAVTTIISLVIWVSIYPSNSFALSCEVSEVKAGKKEFAPQETITINAGAFRYPNETYLLQLIGTSGSNLNQKIPLASFKPNETTFPLSAQIPDVASGTYDLIIETNPNAPPNSERCAQNIEINNPSGGTQNPSCILSVSKADKNQEVKISGSKLDPEKYYDLYLNDEKQSKRFKTKIDGSFEGSFKLTDAVSYRVKIVHDQTGFEVFCGKLTISGPVSGQNPCGAFCLTALGNVPTTAGGLAQKLLTIAIGIAGGLALILMVIGSIRVLTSSGDQQKLSAGRDMIVAAVAGLLFLIFSVLILKFIGGEILNIPFFFQ